MSHCLLLVVFLQLPNCEDEGREGGLGTLRRSGEFIDSPIDNINCRWIRNASAYYVFT